MTDDVHDFRRRLQELFAAQRLAVLATSQEGWPYASLVAFAAADDLRRIYVATPRSTRKYAHLAADDRVALLVNDSLNASADFHRAVSVTAQGRAVEIAKAQHPEAVAHYLARHPYLEDFLGAPSCALIRIAVERYTLVRNFQDVANLSLTHDLDPPR